ncbi:hypothetical protein GGF43_004423 [Coemansia sp. RSA 2618]|nr:hypothetical protein GGF43_004423 [Coemansia sp. RSA 2618]
MTIQLTRGLLDTFLTNAESKSQQTLADSRLTPFVFANTSLLWLIPAHVNHPLRRILGLSAPFILITAANAAPAEYELQLRRTRSVVSGAEPLAVWEPLVSLDPDNIAAIAHYEFEWGVQNMQPMDRNQARLLTAQYAQLLPELRQSEDESALPMLVFTKEVEEVQARLPFYLAVFSPSSPSMFANVVAVRARDAPLGRDADSINILEHCTGGTRVQHWAEYDLLGSPAQAESVSDVFKSNIDTRAADYQSDDEAGSVISVNLASSMSHVVLHGIWTAETRKGVCAVEIPPAPSPSAQWVLELLSVPLSQEPDASKPLRALYMEIKRLETWCSSWMAGTRWMDAQQTEAAQTASVFGTHMWQSKDSRAGSRRASADNTITLDESKMEVDAGDVAQKTPLEQHRQAFAKKIDEFIDASIYETRGSTSLAQLGHIHDTNTLETFPVREDLDFAERLWNLTHYAHDDDDLSEAIAAVAEGLETRKLQPYIHHTNESPLAQVIRQALQMAQAKTLVDAEAEKERLAGQLDMWIDEQPLDPFVQIGLHKLRADFWFHFVGGHLATPRQIELFLDTEKEPMQLVARFWLLLRVLEVWWLLQQAVPGMPRQFSCQVIGTLLDHFAAALDGIDCDGSEDREEGVGVGPQYEDWLKTSVFLPVYSTEVQTFVAAIADGFDPARYTATAADSDSQGSGRSQYALTQLTKTPGLVDRHFAIDDAQFDALADNASDACGLDDEYAVFEAQLL